MYQRSVSSNGLHTMIKKIVTIIMLTLVATSIYFLITPYYEVRWIHVTYDTDNQYLAIADNSDHKVKFDFWYDGDFEKSYNLENHKLGNNWSLVFKDESENIDEIQLDSLILVVDGEVLKVRYKKDPLKFELNDMYKDIIATQTINLKKIPKDSFILEITGMLTTKYGEVLPFSYTQKGEVHSASNYYSGFYLLMPTV